MNEMNAKTLLGQLQGEGLLADEQTLAQSIISAQVEDALPLYLRILAGVGAFFASLSFIGFLIAAELIDFDEYASMTFWGGLFVALAIAMERMVRGSSGMGHAFGIQSSFAAMAVGKTLFVVGLATWFDSTWAVPIATAVITLITYQVYRLTLDRFLSCTAVWFGFWFNLYERGGSESLFWLHNVYVLLTLGLGLGLLMSARVRQDYIPIAYASLLGVAWLVCNLHITPLMDWLLRDNLFNSAFLNICLALALCGVSFWSVGHPRQLANRDRVAIAVLALCLAWLDVPGILLGMVMMVLGYARHDRLLLGAGGLCIGVFLWFFYYSLQLTLLAKSASLIGGGIALLLAALYVHKRREVSHA